MREDKTSTNAISPFAKDDRPLVAQQNAKTKRWETIRKDNRYEEGGRVIATDLHSRDEADTIIERERFHVPRTDSTKISRTRRVFYFGERAGSVLDKIFGQQHSKVNR